MNRRILLAGTGAILVGRVRLEPDAGTPIPVATPEPVTVATRHGFFQDGAVDGIKVSCQLAVYSTREDAEAASVLEPVVDIDPKRDPSVIGPESIDMPYGLEDLAGSSWHAHSFEGAAAAETIYDWIIFRVDRAVWTFEVVTWPDEDVHERAGKDAVLPALEAIWNRAPDPTPRQLSQETIDEMMPQDDDFAETVEWVD